MSPERSIQKYDEKDQMIDAAWRPHPLCQEVQTMSLMTSSPTSCCWTRSFCHPGPCQGPASPWTWPLQPVIAFRARCIMIHVHLRRPMPR